MNRVQVTVDDLRRAANAEIRKTWSAAQWLRWLDAAAALKDQTFRNIVLIKLQMPEATWVAGREAWQRSGRRILGRQSGIRIISPASSHRLELRTSSLQGHGVATVWDVSQTDSPAAVPRSVEAGADVTPRGVCDALTRVANDAGFTVAWQPLPMDAGTAATDCVRRRIVLADDLDDRAAVAALAHELAHVRMHKPTQARGAPCVGLSKLEAESVAHVVLSYFGLSDEVSLAGSLAAARVSKQRAERVVPTLGERVAFASRRLIGSTELHLPRSEARRPRGGRLDAVTRAAATYGRDALSSEPDGPTPGF